MRIKLDENLPTELKLRLAELGHDVDTVPEENLGGCDDPEVWRQTQVAGRFLITQDLDFSDIRRFAPGTHAGILLVRLEHPSRTAVAAAAFGVFTDESLGDLAGCLVVVTEVKIRVRRAIGP